MRQVVSEDQLIARSYGILMRSGTPWRNPAYDWDQIVTAASGSFRLLSNGQEWRITPGFALLIPGRNEHQIYLREQCDIRAIFFKGEKFKSFQLVSLSNLGFELILKASLCGALSRENSIHRAIVDLLWSELADSPSVPLEVVWPASAPALRAAQMLTRSSRELLNIATVSADCGMVRRTLERRFRRELGKGIGQWLREYNLIQAAHLIISGAAVSEAAFRAGYSTVSSFITAFKRQFRVTPAQFAKFRGSTQLESIQVD